MGKERKIKCVFLGGEVGGGDGGDRRATPCTAAKRLKGNTFALLTHIFSCRSYFSPTATTTKSRFPSPSETVMSSGFFVLFAPGEVIASESCGPPQGLGCWEREVRKYPSLTPRSPGQCGGNAAADGQGDIFGGILHGKTHPRRNILKYSTHGIAPLRGNGAMTRGELSA